MKVPILSSAQIEADADALLARYFGGRGEPHALPVPIVRIADMLLEIPIEWAPIPPRDGVEYISKITQPSFGIPSRIVMNEDLRETTFRDHPELENTATAHEVGHWHYHVEHSRIQQLSLLPDDGEFLSTAAAMESGTRELLRRVVTASDDWWREWQAHTFMRHVLMPRPLLDPLVDDIRAMAWPALYDLRDRCGVTISALAVHLCKRGDIRIEGKAIRDLRAESGRQLSLSRR